MSHDNPATRALLAQTIPVPPGVTLDALLAQRPVFFDLPALLQPQEGVLAYCISKIDDKSNKRAKGDWLVVCTERRLLFLSRGLTFEHFELGRDEIASVDESKGLIFYGVKITTPRSIIELFQYGKPDMERVLAALRG